MRVSLSVIGYDRFTRLVHYSSLCNTPQVPPNRSTFPPRQPRLLSPLCPTLLPSLASPVTSILFLGFSLRSLLAHLIPQRDPHKPLTLNIRSQCPLRPPPTSRRRYSTEKHRFLPSSTFSHLLLSRPTLNRSLPRPPNSSSR